MIGSVIDMGVYSPKGDFGHIGELCRNTDEIVGESDDLSRLRRTRGQVVEIDRTRPVCVYLSA